MLLLPQGGACLDGVPLRRRYDEKRMEKLNNDNNRLVEVYVVTLVQLEADEEEVMVVMRSQREE